jgi:hypothetical protein
MGLTATTWPIFSWSDKSLKLDYTNWGDSQPNKSPAPGLCVYANSSLSRGSPPAWGWDDTDCDTSTSIFMCKKASVAGTYYTSKRFGATYIFNSTAANFTNAENACLDFGSHLVSWRSQAEQAEVESFYTNNGFMFPTYHRFYWMGLQAGRSMAPADLMATFGSRWPNFTYTDKSPAPGTPNAYTHWGRYQPLNFPEPDNRFSPELCAGGNASETFGNPKAWGWADTRCNGSFPFMCKVAGAQLLPLRPADGSMPRWLGTAAASHTCQVPTAAGPCRACGGHLL